MASDWLFMGFRESFSGLHFYLRVVSWAAQWSQECMLEDPGARMLSDRNKRLAINRLKSPILGMEREFFLHPPMDYKQQAKSI